MEGGDMTFYALIGVALTVVSSIVTAYIKDYKVKQIEASVSLKSGKEENQKDTIMSLKTEMLNLKKALAEERGERIRIEDELTQSIKAERAKTAKLLVKFESVRVAFGIIYRQYERDFKDDIEKIDLLSELRGIIDE